MPAPKSPSPRRAGRWLRNLFRIGLIAFAAAVVALVIAVGVTMASLPSFPAMMQKPNGQTVRVHAADGTLIVSLGPSYGDWLPYDRIAPVMRDAMVAVEDRRFYSHFGIDPIGIARMFYVAKRLHDEGRRLQGGSTITQQLARNLFLSSNYTYGRKIREALLALALERKFSKQQILELYLNRVYFGGGAYGIDAAARKFFGHPGDHLSLAEASIIAGLVKAPSHYSPSADPQAAVDRARVVLDVMQDAGAITPAQAERAHPEAVTFAPEPKQNSVRYFTDWALAQLDTLVDDQNAPLDVWTTLDLRMQKAADDAIHRTTPAGLQAALVSMENDGAVRAMVGGTDYVSSIYNRATQSVRQPGSAFKLFVYLTALEGGVKPGDPVVDQPVTIDGWSPRNSSRKYLGQIDVRNAFAFSINTVAAQIGQKVGFASIADMAHRFGISTPINTHPSMVLGTSDVRLLDMTRAFASISANGVAVQPYGILKVSTPDGTVLYQHQAGEPRVLVAPFVAAEMTDLLQTAVNTGTARAAQIGRPVAGKTGTTSSNKDGWFLGFSSGLTTGVWMGRDDAKPIPGLQGGRNPAQAFSAYMQVALNTRPVQQFDTQVTLPEWQLEPDDEAYYGDPNQQFSNDEGDTAPAADQPETPPQPTVPLDESVAQPPADEVPPRVAVQRQPGTPPRIDQRWLDDVLRDQRQPAQAPPPR
ncbi:PBP1A family penicillin-binding protein [Sphingomonas nostoxanthinifaciens]|uniref:PBP1A family penicillin-binding protein n=1 Tax=Sphingomonas nostoxanthinifaciens TaxID=2872652 RepID=UPI001CC1FFE3|nr:PBP1A family penicillin-binding protein [Sphingomonas nostoxanthinifaciens]UAK24390.1 PBP1A family penicillin-binding protein [Sphingomonas nostoxanthinifaciens]